MHILPRLNKETRNIQALAAQFAALSALTGADSATGDKYFVLDVSDTSASVGGTIKTHTRAELAVAVANAFTLSGAALSIGAGAFTAGAVTFSGNLMATASGAWPTSIIGKSGSRTLVGNDGWSIVWNEAAAGAGNFGSLLIGAKTGVGATTIGGGSIRGGTVNASDYLGFVSIHPQDAAGDLIQVVRFEAGSSAFTGTLSATGNTTTNGNAIVASANAATWTRGQASELLTLSTSGTTSDTSADLLPANSIIESVVARVTTTITTATDWKLGDPTTAGRFTAANSTLTEGTTDVGLVHIDQSGAAGPRQTAAAKVRVTTTGTPGAGAIRITVFYRTLVAPTS